VTRDRKNGQKGKPLSQAIRDSGFFAVGVRRPFLAGEGTGPENDLMITGQEFFPVS